MRLSGPARARGISEEQLRSLIKQRTQPRQFGILGEERVNVLELNLALNESYSKKVPSLAQR
ncbi:MAG TPA: potassium-transporting ATPase subunit C [Candidatus Angelobacter sp.]|jgi:K+-transporting ATPase ATPase C chain